ncbi:hypothetical protein DPEC_G00155950 [Dallia pectoralis]|uniref:Uncharacterized protein n=1 Tax=Dallia pectoralis TaxID=75939 RepID=A0ACC2GL32_DALPE|nr:hypothetical protein DPEC_G00155950 [Dallia pectoralis]
MIPFGTVCTLLSVPLKYSAEVHFLVQVGLQQGVKRSVYFDSCVRNIKFVDSCGKYRLPLMHHLCSPECTSPYSSNPQSDAESDDERGVAADRLQRVLLR